MLTPFQNNSFQGPRCKTESIWFDGHCLMRPAPLQEHAGADDADAALAAAEAEAKEAAQGGAPAIAGKDSALQLCHLVP